MNHCCLFVVFSLKFLTALFFLVAINSLMRYSPTENNIFSFTALENMRGSVKSMLNFPAAFISQSFTPW